MCIYIYIYVHALYIYIYIWTYIEDPEETKPAGRDSHAADRILAFLTLLNPILQAGYYTIVYYPILYPIHYPILYTILYSSIVFRVDPLCPESGIPDRLVLGECVATVSVAPLCSHELSVRSLLQCYVAYDGSNHVMFIIVIQCSII